jgi:DNA-binding response OmpR family regulator
MAASAFTLLLVDHLPRNLELLVEFLGKEGYQTIGASTYSELDQVLSQQKESIQGALIDIAGFDSRIWERCEQLRAAKIPFLVVSAQMSAAIQAAGLAHGAKSVMKKPLVIKDLVAIIKSILVE